MFQLPFYGFFDVQILNLKAVNFTTDVRRERESGTRALKLALFIAQSAYDFSFNIKMLKGAVNLRWSVEVLAASSW